ncbi:MAG: DMT family transporter [Pseudomonadota bacterium]
MTPRADRLRGHGAMVLFALLISGSFTLGDMAAPHIDPAALTALRFLIAALVVGAVVWPRIRPAHLRAAWRYPILGGLMAAYFILMFEALRLTDPVSTGALFTLTPLMSAGFGWLLLRQITTPLTALSLLAAGLGALWVIFRADLGALLRLGLGPGEILFLIGCGCHALYTPLARLWKRGVPLPVYTLAVVLGGLAVTLAYGAGRLAATDWAALPPIAWATALYLGVVTTAVTFFLVQFATLRLPAGKVMAYGYLVPSFVILWEGLLGHGWVAGQVWLGVLGTALPLLLLLGDDPERRDSA